MSLSVLYDLMYPISVLTNVLSILDTFNTGVTSVAIITAPNWNLNFELMCDASDYEVGAVLGQRRDKVFHAIHYASKVLNDAQINYATVASFFGGQGYLTSV